MKTELVETVIVDDKWELVAEGKMTLEEWMAQAKPGPILKITEHECSEMIDNAMKEE